MNVLVYNNIRYLFYNGKKRAGFQIPAHCELKVHLQIPCGASPSQGAGVGPAEPSDLVSLVSQDWVADLVLSKGPPHGAEKKKTGHCPPNPSRALGPRAQNNGGC